MPSGRVVRMPLKPTLFGFPFPVFRWRARLCRAAHQIPYPNRNPIPFFRLSLEGEALPSRTPPLIPFSRISRVS